MSNGFSIVLNNCNFYLFYVNVEVFMGNKQFWKFQGLHSIKKIHSCIIAENPALIYE